MPRPSPLHPSAPPPLAWEVAPCARSFFATAVAVLVRPWGLAARVPEEGSVRRALGFAWLACAASAVLRGALQLSGWPAEHAPLQGVVSTPDGPRLVFVLQGLVDPWTLPVGGTTAAALGLLGTLLLTPVRLVCAGALVQVALRLCAGSAGRDYPRTVRLLAYGSAPALAAWVPGLGYAFALWAWLLPLVLVVTDAVERAASPLTPPSSGPWGRGSEAPASSPPDPDASGGRRESR